MNIRPCSAKDPAPSARRKNGSVSVIFVALLAIMMILVMAESRALFHLHREVKFLEQQQIKRLNSTNHGTDGIPKSEAK